MSPNLWQSSFAVHVLQVCRFSSLFFKLSLEQAQPLPQVYEGCVHFHKNVARFNCISLAEGSPGNVQDSSEYGSLCN